MADGNQTWRTPLWLFKLLEDLVGQRFKLDAAASKENAKCKRFYAAKENGLLQPWVQATYCNPGFATFGAWLAKAVAEARERELIACCVGPKGCSQSWFHRYARLGRVYAPDQRIAFDHYETGEPTTTAREDTMVYIVGPGFWNRSKTDFDLRTLPVREAQVRSRRST